MALFSRFPGLLLVLTMVVLLVRTTDGFAPSRGLTVTAKTAASSFSSTSLNVGATYGPPMVEDKPHLMIGGRGYYSSNLIIDQAEYDSAVEANARRQRKRMVKYLAAYTAAVCGSMYLRPFLSMFLYLPYLFKAYPMMGAMATCGTKSVVADLISQLRAWNGTFDWRRSLSGMTYGATILGFGSKLAYTKVLPSVCPQGLAGTAMQCGLDNFVLAPAIWIPGAYLVKALFFKVPLKNAWGQYMSDIRHEGLLTKYWKLWLPAQVLNFSIMPQHLRVSFVAAVGFVWFLIQSNMSNKK